MSRPSRRSLLSFALVPALGLVQVAFAKNGEQELKDLKARHQALIAAYNQRDLKALRTFFAADYRYEEATGHKIPLDKYLSGFGEIFKGLPKPGKDSAQLTQVKINGDTATALEKRMVQGFSGKVTGPATTAQTWKKIDGVWKLALERETKD